MSIDFDGGLTCALGVSDLKRSLAWYADTLGFTVLYHLEEMGWAELATPVANVNVGLSQVEAPTVEGGATLTFGVTDIAAARAALEAQDVRFDGPTREIPEMVKLATFFDPDGNKHMLYQGLSTHHDGPGA